jgi:hypothetical protein
VAAWWQRQLAEYREREGDAKIRWVLGWLAVVALVVLVVAALVQMLLGGDSVPTTGI